LGPAYPTNTLGLAAPLWVRREGPQYCKGTQNRVALNRYAANVLRGIQHGGSQLSTHCAADEQCAGTSVGMPGRGTQLRPS